mgnify:CR=1 FL=1
MNKKYHCIEVIVSNEKYCRFMIISAAYEYLETLNDEEEKLKYVNEYFDYRIDITKFIKQFCTYNDEIMIGCLNGTPVFDY